LLMSGSQCSISWCRVETHGAIILGRCTRLKKKKKPHTCKPGKKDAASSQDLGIIVCVTVLPVSTGSYEKGFPMSFNMQLLQGVYHLRRVFLYPKDCPHRNQFPVSIYPYNCTIYVLNSACDASSTMAL